MSTQAFVPHGPFRGSTLADLRTAKTAFVNAGKSGAFNSVLTGASVNGSSYTFGGQEYSREEFGEQLAAAFLMLGSDEFGAPIGRSSAVRFE